MATVAPSMEALAREARPYPAHLLDGCETGLCLFSAAFLGHNDAIHFARHETVTTCVDKNKQRLQEMQDLYPFDWTFRNMDAWEFASEAAENGETWDAVSVDPFTGDAADKSLQSLELWCSLANVFLTVTIAEGSSYVVPGGWRAHLYPRSNTVFWLVLRRMEV